MPLGTVAIIGVGLIGASFALALRKAGAVSSLSGSGRTEATLKRAKEKGIIDSYFLDPADACRDADLIVLATPVGSFSPVMAAIRNSIKPGAIVTDVGSVKGALVRSLEADMPEGAFFIGAHPIAGSERSGLEAASADLFAGALCIATPTERSHAGSLSTVKGLWAEAGATVIETTPEEHDRIFSSVSHMPHAVAYALVNTVRALDPSFLSFAGQGFRDTTRIALSAPNLWSGICRFNGNNIAEHLDALIDQLAEVRRMLRTGAYEELERYFQDAKNARESLG